MAELSLPINLALDSQRIIQVPIASNTTVEDVCIYICKKLEIGTLARHLFAIRTSKNLFLRPNDTFEPEIRPGRIKFGTYEFRIRFKMARIEKLKKLDYSAYNYYFHQAKNDVLDNKVPEFNYEKCRRELLGLGTIDMYRVMLEKGLPRETVERDYKKYVPKELLKKHSFFIKRPIHDILVKFEQVKRSDLNADFFKSQYIYQFEEKAPEYLAEFYKAQLDPEKRSINIVLKIVAPHLKDGGIKYYNEDDSKKEQWTDLCTIEDLGFISIGQAGELQISRKTGIVINIKFSSRDVLWSFVTLLDGYYRLSCRWTFNLCKELETKSLRQLLEMKCHGPVGGEFSYAKLEAKTNNRLGCFIIRESETSYTTYYIDACVKDGAKPKTFKLEKIAENAYIFHDDLKRYSSIQELVADHRKSEIYLNECIPPSEFDVSPLLLCRNEIIVGDTLTDIETLPVLNQPTFINIKDLQFYKGQRKDGSRKLTFLHRGMWRVEKGKKVEVALKFYEESQGKHSTEFLTLASQWAFLRSPDLVRLFGIALKPMAMAMEYFNLGPLDQYLRDNRGIMKPEDLLEAAGCLAKALWDINEQNGIIHGRIRCRKLLVYCHDENRFRVKLSDPGIHTKYKESEIHWLPPECYKTFDKKSTAADVWATATTFYEIFKFGELFPVTDMQMTMKWYLKGNRLPKPKSCPEVIYNVMMECWEADIQKRKQPQQLCRDVTQILFRVYNNRKKHWYAIPDHPRSETAMSTQSLVSTKTAITDISDTADISESTDLTQLISQSENSSSQMRRSSSDDSLIYLDSDSSNSTSPPTSSTFECSSFFGETSSMQRIIAINDDINVTLIGIIGRGYYGKVFKGYWDNRQDHTRKIVAVKELNNSTTTNFPEEQAAAFSDFEREINIMQSLSHPNIVKILAVQREPELHLIMEYIEHKSLLDYINITRNEITEKQLLKYALDIAMGMNYLGLQNIVHRDLAIRNVLVVDETTVKISDFGLAQCLPRGCDYYYIQNPNKGLPIKWHAPESLEHGKFSVKSDVWSYGVTLYEMFSLGEEPPFLGSLDAPEAQRQQKLLESLKDGIRYQCPKSCPQAIYVLLMIPCWQLNPDKRPKFLQLAATITERLNQL
ncbi:tyrosine-protein kinase hopscotch-like isoform X2 [Anthonomus grandis grandis]|uniref:tyrosine-protein kinase hopscotch-like isoform X2 n=1 Tax=Anthonomus grandis grandis TaxID=2921223 RepID=UPI002164FA75|nr:tyrosine-protein kinase hopscotch-like isoform X2 [Anthonomus grandis grandis]